MQRLDPATITGLTNILPRPSTTALQTTLDSLANGAIAHPPRTQEDYQIGVICALATEKAAMVAMLDETHLRLKKEKGDENEYTLGRIGVHNVVIASLPAGLMGNGPAAIVAKDMLRSFPIKFGLVVGVGGGVWSKKDDIRLGDVVVSQPTGAHGGVVQWDFGKMGKEAKFRRTGSLDKPPPVLLHALQELRTFDITDGVNLEEALALMIRNKPRMGESYRHQGIENDVLFKPDYDHEGDETCDGCDAESIMQRPVREDTAPRVHYGNIASGNEVMKHGTTRDKIAEEEGVVCFEMEAAGLMDNFRCLVIRGICDYADSHKNKIWQPYAAATAAVFARALLTFVDEQEVIKTPIYPKPLRVLPFGRNQDFVGRRSQLNRLLTILHTENSKEDCPRAALVGLGGVGKTQIALECAFRLQSISPICSVFWIRANDATSFDSAYRDIGQQLKIPGLEDSKADVKNLVKAWLSKESTGNWLMIVDNADDFEIFYNHNDANGPGALSEYLPLSMLGAILFTTRDRKAATKYAGANVIDVDKMDDIESTELLRGSFQKKQLIEDKESTAKLLQSLVNLPLAIMQAAAYLNANAITIAEYLNIYEESSDNIIELLSENFEDKRRYSGAKNPIASTWLISFEQIRSREPLAAGYMAFISCIKEQDIPWDLLPSNSKIQKTRALGTLKAFGFIKERVSGTSYDMHQLVHKVVQNWLKIKDEWRSWNEKTLKQITKIFPQPKHENRVTWMMYLPHAQCAIANFEKSFSKSRELPLSLLDDLGASFRLLGKDAEAETMHRQKLQLRETVLGKDHPHTLASTSHLAISLVQQGKYTEAEAMQRQTLRREETVLGEDHPQTLASMGNLAESLRHQRKYAEAEAMNRQVLRIQETVLGKDHPDTLASINNLAISLVQQGKFAKAETMQRQALQLREIVLGKDHPHTLASMSNLASSLLVQGKYAEAEAMHRQTLRLQETVLRKEHPDTLVSMHNLANSLRYQRKYAEAEAIYQQTLRLQETVLRKGHPNMLASMGSLADALLQQGKNAEAETMHRQTLQLSETVLGKDHPSTLASMSNLADSLRYQHKYIEAEAMYRQTLLLQEIVLGKNHPYTLMNISKLAISLLQQGKYAEAEAACRQVLRLQETVLRKDHPDTLASISILAISLRRQGKYAEAEATYRQALQLQERVLGKDHLDTLASMNNLVISLVQQGKYAEAEAMGQ